MDHLAWTERRMSMAFCHNAQGNEQIYWKATITVLGIRMKELSAVSGTD